MGPAHGIILPIAYTRVHKRDIIISINHTAIGFMNMPKTADLWHHLVDSLSQGLRANALSFGTHIADPIRRPMSNQYVCA
jgi:hypothetical protein